VSVHLNWPEAAIRDVCQLVGASVNPQDYPCEEFAHFSIPAFDDRQKPAHELGESILSNKTAFPVGAVLFSKLNPRIPRLWHVTKDPGPRCICSTEFLPLLPRPEVLRPDYLALALQNPNLISMLRSRVAAATKSRERLKPSDVLSATIPLPPLPEQQRIATLLRERLDAAARMRAAAKCQMHVVDALLEAELREAFRGIATLAVAGSRPSAPGGWRWHRLTDLARLESGHTPSRRHPEWWGGNIPWLALPDIRELDCQVAEETLEMTNDLGIAHSSARVLPPGTVVLSRTASVGFVAMMGRPMATSQDFVNWVCGPDLHPRFLMYLLRASRTFIRQLSSGAIHKTVYVPTVKAFNICAPDIAEQKRIADEVRDRLSIIGSIRERLVGQAEEVDRVPAVLLRHVFSGGL
jgi:type I restriction enzyme S subunit